MFKKRLVYKNAVALAYYESCRVLVMGSWPGAPDSVQNGFLILFKFNGARLTLSILVVWLFQSEESKQH